MESDQCVGNEEISAQLTEEEKASVDEILKQAENESLEKIQALVGALKNQTEGPLTKMTSNKWAGHIIMDYPDPLIRAGTFIMSALLDKGIEAAVVYSGKNKAGVECAWLLAFVATKATGRRVYAKCGRKDKFIHIDWADVKNKLEKASSHVRAHDKETGTSLYAAITGGNGKSAVGAAFLG